MKHVREQIPDVQSKRPEVSAALAQVIDTATAKKVEDRYANDAELIADLEDVLAIETSRAGNAAGEVTAVLRTLPSRTQQRIPYWLRHRAIAALVVLVVIAAVVGAGIWLAGRAHHGTGKLDVKGPSSAPIQVQLCQTCAYAFNPLGTTPQNPNEAGYAIDSNPSDEWTTVDYYDDVLTEAGIGLYVDAHPRTKATFIKLLTTTPGFDASIYINDSTPSPSAWPGSWVKVASATGIHSGQNIKLNTGNTPHRYYLVWITKLPPQKQNVALKLALYK
jgi:serine/threonine-protein kinase